MRPSPRRLIKTLLGTAVLLSGLLMPAATAGTHADGGLLPDLAMHQPDDFHLERKPGGVRWLRFSTTIVNVGAGPFDVYGWHPTGGAITGDSILNVTQRLLDGIDPAGNRAWSDHPTPATMFYAGDGHNHWHVFGLQDWDLAFAATPNDTIESGAKTGFCFWDNVDLGWGTPAEYSGSWACHVSGGGTRVPMGQAVGWGDEYPWSIAFQYIDMTGLPYGDYCLTLTADPRGEFIEQTRANNTTRTLISVRTNGVTVLDDDCGTDATPPATPSGVTATPGDGSVALDWAEGTESDLAGYRVYRDGSTAAAASVADSAYADTGLENDVEYCYEVTALDAAGNESARSSPPACATPTAGAATNTMHVGDLDGSRQLKGKSGRWDAFVTVTVHDESEVPLSGATVTGTWSGARTATASGTTGSDGTVVLSTGTMAGSDSVTFTVTGITHSTLTHEPADDHDVDGGSDGTSITISSS